MSLAPVPNFEPPTTGRVLPHDMLAEQSTIGAMLISRDAVAEVQGTAKPTDFYAPKHETIYLAILALFESGEPTDVITVTDKLTKEGNLIKAGGADYLHTLTSIVPTAANADYYARIVAEKAILRRLVEVGTKIAQLGYSNEGEITELVNTAQSDVYTVVRQSTGKEYSTLDESINAAMEDLDRAAQRGGEITGVPTGFIELDNLIHGFQGGQLIIVAARPAIGKSTLALDFVRNASIRHNIPSVFFSLEMSKSEIAMRLLSAESAVTLQNMRKGSMDDKEWGRLSMVRGNIDKAPFYIDDSANLTLVEIRAKCRRMKEQLGLRFIVIDYLQLMSSGKKVESRQQEVSEFSRSLKLLAKELDIPVIAISQLNRNSEQTKDKRPEISQLRESGSLEQDADIVILIHREGLGEKEHPKLGEAELILAKHRNGPTGTVHVTFQGHYSRFANMKQ